MRWLAWIAVMSMFLITPPGPLGRGHLRRQSGGPPTHLERALQRACLPGHQHHGSGARRTKGVANKDRAKRERAVADLYAYAKELGVFLNGANPNLPVEAVDGLMRAHVAVLTRAIDAQGSKKLVDAYRRSARPVSTRTPSPTQSPKPSSGSSRRSSGNGHPSGNNRKGAPTDSICNEVPPVQCKHLLDAFTLGHAHQRGIRQIHRQVAVLPDQSANTRDVSLLYRENPHRAAFDHFEQRVLRFRREAQQVHRLRQWRPRGRQGGADASECRDTSGVILVVPM